MIDLNHLEQYRENNRIEAKRAVGGLPQSIWETYSAFANTLGGLILLGVEELEDKSLHAIRLPDPEELVRDFWTAVNDPNVASVNVLSEKDVTIEPVDGKRIVVIRVPRASCAVRPVWVNGSPKNCYFRNGEGDCQCTAEELNAMFSAPTDPKQERKTDAVRRARRRQFRTIVAYLTEHPTVRLSEIADATGLKQLRVRTVLRRLIADGIVVAEGTSRNRTYRLKY
ncbi:MAG: putative DNA binding domain-containing protein [Clostridia bacterium]|nr:putative DNA binding domain-containing protein [Clostridia bacterium]